jgi:pimeloyl-ACP methyl ester carboxylesterase
MSVTGVEEHVYNAAYPDSWTGEIAIPWGPDHDSTNDPIIMNSFAKDGIRLTGTSADGDAWAQFIMPTTLPEEAKYAKELFMFVTAINARPYQCIGQTLGVIDLIFAGGNVGIITESYELKIGYNIRNWWSGTDPIYYVDFFTPGSDPEAREIDWVPVSAGGWAGLDVVRLIVPDQYRHMRLLGIRVTAKPVISWQMDVRLRLSGICTFFNMPTVVDPNPVLMDGDTVTTDRTRLISSAARVVNGLAADGVTPILFRVPVDGPGEVEFTITDENGQQQDIGTLSTPGGTEKETTLNVEVDQLANGQYMTFAVLTAPVDFCRDSDDVDEPDRPIRIEAVYTPVGSGSPTVVFNKEIKLYRPPVMLIHGIWSSAIGCWGWPLLNDSRFTVHNQDYKNANSFHFNENIPIARAGVANAVNKMREQNVAATQADVFAHSMGGLLTRLYISNVNNDYYRDDNFMKGDIHKFITVDTPHLGSPLANILVNSSGQPTPLGYAVQTILGPLPGSLGYVSGGAVFDLMADRAVYMPVNVPSHAIVGTTGSDVYLALLVIDPISLQWDRTMKFLKIGLDSILDPQHDLIVPKKSQEGGLSDSSNISYISLDLGYSIEDGIHFGGVTKSDKVNNDVVIPLLNARTTDTNFFAEGFPAVNTTSSIPIESMGVVSPGTEADSQLIEGEIRITSPIPGTQVTPNSKIQVTVESTGIFVPDRVLVLSNYGAAIDDVPPFEMLIDVPSYAIDEVHLYAYAFDASSNLAVADEVYLSVDNLATITGISVVPEKLYLYSFLPQHSISVVGHYDDGFDRDITSSALGTTYELSDPTIASIDSEGNVIGKSVGRTILKITNGIQTTEIDVEVVSIPIIGDTDHDGDVDLVDLVNLSGNYGTTMGGAWSKGDFDGDGDVDSSDLAEFAVNYGYGAP